MRVEVKICGLCRPAVVDAAVKGGASHIGFVFTRRPSIGSVSLAQAAALAARVPSHIRKVGVFHEQDSILFIRAVAYAGLHVLQLHATNPVQAAKERNVSGRSVWGVAAIRSADDLLSVERWQGAVDRILYDVQGDLQLLAGMKHPLPWVLGGRIDGDNVADAIAATGAKMVDVSAGVESAPGIKDPQKIAAVLDAIRALRS